VLSRSLFGKSLLLMVVIGLIIPFAGEAGGVPMLKDFYAEDFLIGFAARSNYWMDEPLLDHFNAVTAENMMKWEALQPRPGDFRLNQADNLVQYAQEHGMEVIGHTLVWHNQTPDWVFKDENGKEVSREVLLARMEEHIKTVVGHFKGRIKGWDVVNEAVEYNPATGKWELRDTPWLRIIGEDYIEHAFRFAHEADPDAELYYNDYNAADGPKRDAIYQLVKGLLDKGIRVDGIGMQGHWDLQHPSVQAIREAIELYSSLGVKVHITELDISVYTWDDRANRYPGGLPEAVQDQQANRYAAIFRLFKEYSDVIERVTWWGVKDSHSWKNNFPVPNRPDYPLLFDGRGNPKPSFWAVVDPSRPWRENQEKYGTAQED
jgi:endo-1,4-beta-xylanase